MSTYVKPPSKKIEHNFDLEKISGISQVFEFIFEKLGDCQANQEADVQEIGKLRQRSNILEDNMRVLLEERVQVGRSFNTISGQT